MKLRHGNKTVIEVTYIEFDQNLSKESIDMLWKNIMSN